MITSSRPPRVQEALGPRIHQGAGFCRSDPAPGSRGARPAPPAGLPSSAGLPRLRRGRARLIGAFLYLHSLLVGGAGPAAAVSAGPAAPSTEPLLRFPAVSGETVVFSCGEDLWSAPVAGGVATRLTIHEGEERFPRFSPDGALIAFTAEYDGNADIYVMNVHGGEIRRVTWHPGFDEVVGWHPVKGKILFRSNRASWSRFDRLFLIAPDGTGLEELILHEAAAGSFSADGNKIAYTKVTSEGRTWKRYRGGTAPEVYLYDLASNEERTLTDFPGNDQSPLWVGERIYFTSDRDGVLNLYACDPVTGVIEQVTRHTDHDVHRPSTDGRRIVYEAGGSLWLLDAASGRAARIPVEIRAEAPETRPYTKKVDKEVSGLDLSPNGKRALLVARGEVFTVPAKEGPTRDLTGSCGSRERGAAWSPDGKWVAFLSDRSGEYEIYLADPLGEKEPQRLTTHAGGYRHTLRWSPDSKKIAFADQTLRCFYVDVETQKVVEVDHALYEDVDVSLDLKPICDYAWSPDSRFLAYSKMGEDLLYQVYVYSLETGEKHCASDGLFSDFGPVFTTDGEHLLFVSNRRFDPVFCDFEWEMVYKKAAGIYALTLQKGGKPLLPPQSDEGEPAEDEAEKDGGEEKSAKDVRKGSALARGPGNSGETGILGGLGEPALTGEPTIHTAIGAGAPAGAPVFAEAASRRGEAGGGGKKKAKEEQNGDDGEKKAPPKVVIDFPGLAGRVEAFPLHAGNYRDLAVNEDAVFFLDAEEGDFNRFEFREVGPRELRAFSFEEREERTVIEKIDAYRLSADGKTILYRKGETLGLIEAGKEKAEGKALDLSGLEVRLDPPAEWRQMFDEAWRMERDFYYEPGMHGLDWPAIREKYGRLLDRATCRQDLSTILGEMIGELSTSHTYVYGGDRRRKAEPVSVGLLGADYEVDEASGRYRFRKIYGVPDWTQEVIPPLARPGVDVRTGDYLIAVDGDEVTAERSVYSYFQGLAARQVKLLVNDRPSREGAREAVVIPLRGEATLRYLDWVEHNRRVAEEASGGRIGYLHLPDTYTGSTREFPKYFYSQTRKEGLIVDGRFNGGGLDPDIFLQRLDKRPLAYWTRRYSHDQTTPAVCTAAHLACLTNRQAGSGGDMLPMEFRMKGMGPVIGTRSWGGLVGISMYLGLVDGGGITAPDYRIYDPSGKWIVENVGVEPDIPVDLHPAEMARGYDAQLMKAIEVLKEKIEKEPRPWPQHEPFPEKQ